MSATPDQVLDCSGLACPMPILKTKKAIDDMEAGQVLQMISTDAGSTADVAAWTDRTGHALLEASEADGKYVFLIEKKG
ncbi:MAG: sulfurtransferase TusA family protein [Actinobacteria bacterium]|nr:sulfurtransferase TusA family protein [Actinomycetota bacterium]